jgi:hypothetical protein
MSKIQRSFVPEQLKKDGREGNTFFFSSLFSSLPPAEMMTIRPRATLLTARFICQ